MTEENIQTEGCSVWS